jgi:hypothetical protein
MAAFGSATTVQSDVTFGFKSFQSFTSTQAAAFALPFLAHYWAEQGTLGAGSSVGNQYGFIATSSLTGASGNYGFFGDIAATAGRWNFYANGTAANFFKGGLQIGGTASDVGAGNVAVTGWQRVGSATVPANTTAGDLTAARLAIGNGSLSAATARIDSALSSASSAVSGLKIVMGSGINQGFNLDMNLTGTISTSYVHNANNFKISSDNVATHNNGSFHDFANGFAFEHRFGGSSMLGGRQALAAFAYLTAASSASNSNRNYVAVTGVSTALAGDGGTSTALANTKGALFGGGFVGSAVDGATNLTNVTAAEFNTAMQTGSSAAIKSIIQLASRTDDAVSGSLIDTMIWMTAQSGAAKFTDGILFYQDTAGAADWPIKSTGTIIRTAGTGTVTNGIDLSATTISGLAWKSNGFQITGGGELGIGAAAATTAWAKIAAGTTTKAQLNFAASAPPDAPADGDWWVEAAAVKIRLGGVTKTFTLT